MIEIHHVSLKSTLTVAALLLVLIGCDPGATTSEVEFRIPVEVEEVTIDAVEDLIVTTGTLRTVESVVLNVETPGYLILGRDAGDRRLAEGAHVRAGQLIAEVTGEDARLASRIDATRQQLATAKQELNRRQRLYDEDLIPEEQLRTAEAAYENARHEFEVSELTADKTTITTPIDGVLLRLARDEEGMPIADGQMVSPGYVVARIAPIGELIADIDLVGPELSRVRPGQPVRLRHYAFEGLEIDGRVLRLSPSMNPSTHTFRAEVEVPNVQQLLLPGMFVEVTIIVERREGVAVVPRESVTERAGKSVVFLLDGQRVTRRDVRLGLGDDHLVEVIEGLEPGQRIVVRGLETLTDGTRVRVAGN